MAAMIEFYKCDLQERDEELQLHLTSLFSKFHECEHRSTMATCVSRVFATACFTDFLV